MKISVITAVRNARGTIERTIGSVRGQSWPNVEYIVVDGLSTDGTRELLEERRSSIDSLVIEGDNGVYDAFNKGLRRATGDIVGFLNADDEFAHADVLKKIAETFVTTNADATFADMLYVDAQDESRITRRYNSGTFRPGRIAWGIMPGHPTLYLRKAVYDRFGEYDASYRIGGDFELVARVFGREPIQYAYIPQVLIRMRTGGLSTRGLSSKLTITREMKRACEQNGIRTNYFKLACRAPFKALELFRTAQPPRQRS